MTSMFERAVHFVDPWNCETEFGSTIEIGTAEGSEYCLLRFTNTLDKMLDVNLTVPAAFALRHMLNNILPDYGFAFDNQRCWNGLNKTNAAPAA